MHPWMVVRELRALEGQIVYDMRWPGMPATVLAPCTGRLVTAVRWVNGQTQRVQVLFEEPVVRDEPRSFLFDPSGVTGVRFGKTMAWMTLGRRGEVVFWIKPEAARERYVTYFEPGEAALVAWSVAENEWRLSIRDVMERLGVNYSQAERWTRALCDSGLLAGHGRGYPRLLTVRAAELAGVAYGHGAIPQTVLCAKDGAGVAGEFAADGGDADQWPATWPGQKSAVIRGVLSFAGCSMGWAFGVVR